MKKNTNADIDKSLPLLICTPSTFTIKVGVPFNNCKKIKINLVWRRQLRLQYRYS